MGALSSGIASVQGPLEQSLRQQHEQKMQQDRQLLEAAHQDWFPVIHKYAQGDPSITDEYGQLALKQYSNALSAHGPSGKNSATMLNHAVEQMRQQALLNAQRAATSGEGKPVPGPAPVGQVAGSLQPPPPVAATPADTPAATPPTSPVQPGAPPMPISGFRADPVAVAQKTAQAQAAGQLAGFQALTPMVQEMAQRKQNLIEGYMTRFGMTKEQATEAVEGRTVPFAPVTKLSPGEELHSSVSGGILGQSAQPTMKELTPGSSLAVIPPVAPGGTSGQAASASSGMQTIQGPPPLPDKTTMDALTAYAGQKGLPDWKAVPTSDWPKARAAWAESSADPELRTAKLQGMATLEALRGMHAQMIGFQQQMATLARGDRSWASAQSELDKLGKPLQDQATRMGRLQDTLNQGTPQADALIAPELLTAMAGGQGSGLRMNEAEIHRVVGGRSKWEDLKAAINKWQIDPKAARSITPAQDKQIRDLVAAATARLQSKQSVVNGAYSKALGSSDPMEHRRIVEDARKALMEVDVPTPTSVSGSDKVQQLLKKHGF